MLKQDYTTEDFIEEYTKVHGDKGYDFTETIYVNAKTKIKIKCPKHGMFKKIKHAHLHSKGCPDCAAIEAGKRSTERAFTKFLKEAPVKYNNQYVYYPDTFIGMRKDMKMYCIKHKKVFYETPYNHIRDSICPTCAHEKRILSQEEAESRLKELGPKHLRFMPFKYDGNKTKVPYECVRCGHKDKACFNNLTSKTVDYGCSNCGSFLTRAEIDRRIKDNLDEGLIIKPFTYIGTEETRVDVYCTKCKRTFKVYLWTVISENERTRTGCGCDYTSRGERRIKALLEDKQEEYKEEYSFKDCSYKNVLPFDFYLPKYDLLIEYHGKQHYKYTPFFHKTEEEFLLRQHKDKIKKEYAEKNHKFLEIPYWDLNNIEELLDEAISAVI